MDETLRVLLCGMYLATKDQVYLDKFEQNQNDTRLVYATLAKFWKNDRAKLQALNDAWAANQQYAAVVRTVAFNTPKSETISDILGGPVGIFALEIQLGIKKPDQRFQIGRMAQSGLEQVFARDAQISAKAEQDLQKSVREINTLLLAGLVLSAISSIGCWLYFSTSISSRLKRLMNNMSLLGEQHAESLSVGGSDEITSLNQAIQVTSKKLIEAQQFQAQTIRIVVDELEIPLRKAGASFLILRQSGIENLSEKGVERLNHSSQEIARLRKLVNELTQLETVRVKIFSLVLEIIDLSAIAQSAADILSEFASSRKVDLILENRDKVMVKGDSDRLVQVAVNLISNAIKFSPEGAAVAIAVTTVDGYGRLSVKDQGPGISEEFRSRIFQRYEQAAAPVSDKKEGSGLGLSLSKDLIEAQNGSLNFSSVPGEGATFWFNLPLRSAGFSAGGTAADSRATAWKPTLWRKGFTLVMVPLCVQVVTVATLWMVLSSARENIQEFERAKMIASSYAQMINAMGRATFYAMLFNVTRNEQCRKNVARENESIYSRIAAVKTVIASSKELKDNLDELKKLVQFHVKTESEMMDAEQNAPVARWLGAQKATKIENLIVDAQTPLRKSILHDVEIMKKRSLAFSDVQSWLEVVLVVSALVAGIVSAGLGLYIVRGITRRLADLLLKTEDFITNKTLTEPSSCDDELAFLDRSFYNAAKKLVELENFKREMTAITSHELRTPLSSLMALTELIENEVFGVVTSAGAKALQLAQANISDLIDMITNLLDLEKMQTGRILVAPVASKVDDILELVESKGLPLAQEKDMELSFLQSGLSVRADSRRLVQALSAVLYGLIDSLPMESQIALAATATKRETNIILSATTKSQYEPWSQEGGRQRLARDLCRLIAEQHGGSFSISHAGKQRFILHLPNN